MSLAFNSLQKKTIQEVLEWYNYELEILSRERARLLAESFQPDNLLDPRFLGMTDADIDVFFSQHKNELDFLTMLALMAAAEAALQLNYENRLLRRLKDPVSKRFKKIQKGLSRQKRHERANLEEHILDTWIDLIPRATQSIREFKNTLKLRHWLAHGRYWDPRLARRQYSTEDIYDICDNLLRAIGA